MKPLLLGISGLAGSGKDTAADIFVAKHGFVKVALADPIKRIARDLWGFTELQLWGPSAERNAPDLRYPTRHPHHTTRPVEYAGMTSYRCENCGAETGDMDLAPPLPEQCISYLTPRHALQIIGTEIGRQIYKNTWVDLLLRITEELLTPFPAERFERDIDNYPSHFTYHAPIGINRSGRSAGQYHGAVVPDVRWPDGNEGQRIREEGGLLIRVKRPGEEGLQGAAAKHESETAMAGVPDSHFDLVLNNISDIAFLEEQISAFLEQRQGRQHRNELATWRTIPAPLALPEPRPPRVEEVLVVTPISPRPMALTPSTLLEQRAKDVEAGRIMPFNPQQADVPPFKRRNAAPQLPEKTELTDPEMDLIFPPPRRP